MIALATCLRAQTNPRNDDELVMNDGDESLMYRRKRALNIIIYYSSFVIQFDIIFLSIKKYFFSVSFRFVPIPIDQLF